MITRILQRCPFCGREYPRHARDCELAWDARWYEADERRIDDQEAREAYEREHGEEPEPDR